MEDKTAKDIVVFDQNIEKWGLFTTKKDKKERILTRINKNGRQQTVKVGVIELEGQKRTLTTAEGKIMYILATIWDKAGCPDDAPVSFNLRQVAEKGKTGWGSKVVKLLKTAVINLKTVPILFESCYRTTKNGETIKMTEPITILSHLKLFERYKRGKEEPYFAFSEFQFHPYIMTSLKNKYFKPLRLDVIVELKSETAFSLYRWLDLIMSDKTEFEKEIDNVLATDIGLIHTRPNHLLAQVREACKELEGKDITTGKIVYCQVEKTVDGKRWKLVVRKGKQTETPTEEIKELATVAERKEETLVKLFLKEFGHNREPVAKELDQATKLINRLGIKKAEHVVKYGIREVRKKYPEAPEWFGSLLFCEKEAFDELKRSTKAKRQLAEQKAKERAERESRKQLTTVCLEYTGAGQDVKVAGSFNNWQPEPLGHFNNRWTLFLDLPAGEYQYKLVVDGNWICDPGNPERARDDKGNENSVLKLRNEKVFNELARLPTR